MKHGSRKLGLSIGALLSLIAGLALFNYLVNPYGAWSTELVNPIYRDISHERMAVPYILRTAHPHTLLVGSSRVMLGMPIPQKARDEVLNAGLAGAGIDEIARVIDLGLRNPKLRQIVWGVDFFAVNDKYAGKFDQDTRERLDHPWLTILPDTLFSGDAFQDSRRMVIAALHGEKDLPQTARGPVPWNAQTIESAMSATTGREIRLVTVASGSAGAEQIPGRGSGSYSGREMTVFRNAIERARSAGVEVIFFLNPLSEYELEILRQGGQWEAFMSWKYELLKSGSYLDFSGYNGIARADWLYYDVMHYRPPLGFTVLRRLLGYGCAGCGGEAKMIYDSAMTMNQSDISLAIAEQNARMEAASSTQTRYSRFAAAVLAREGEASGPITLRN
jgi:hypothetical protein